MKEHGLTLLPRDIPLRDFHISYGAKMIPFAGFNMPINYKLGIINENKNDLLIFSENKIFNEWNNHIKNFHLIEYILPTEDLEDLNLVKSKYDFIEQYDFKEITSKELS